MKLWSTLKEIAFPPRLAAEGDLRAFLESRAAYLAQKPMREYCEARAPLLFSTLLAEEGFLAAYERARWRSYPAAFAMVAEAVEGRLRPWAGERAERLRLRLGEIGAEVFEAFPLPAEAGPLFWRRAGEDLARGLALAGLGAPRPPHRIVAARAPEIFDALPVHASLRSADFAMFANNLKLHLVAIAEEFERRADPARLVQELLDKP